MPREITAEQQADAWQALSEDTWVNAAKVTKIERHQSGAEMLFVFYTEDGITFAISLDKAISPREFKKTLYAATGYAWKNKTAEQWDLQLTQLYFAAGSVIIIDEVTGEVHDLLIDFFSNRTHEYDPDEHTDEIVKHHWAEVGRGQMRGYLDADHRWHFKIDELMRHAKRSGYGLARRDVTRQLTLMEFKRTRRDSVRFWSSPENWNDAVANPGHE